MARRNSYQRGSVRKVEYSSGPVFVGRYRERTPEGGWRHRSITLRTCATKKDAQWKLDAILTDLNKTDGVVIDGNEPFRTVLDQLWPNYMDSKGIKRSTRYAYGVMVRKWIQPRFGDTMLKDITPREIGDFMAELKATGRSAQYRLNIYSLLRLLLDLAVEYDLIEATPIRPKIHRPSVERAEKPVFTVDEARAIIDAVPERFRAAVATLAVTGLRAGELAALKWRDVDFLGRSIRVRGALWRGTVQTPKTKASAAEVSIPGALVETLKIHRRDSRFTEAGDFVFADDDGSPLNPDKLRRRAIYPALEQLGIPRRSRASGCHAFRHLAGSVAHRETGSVKLAQQLLRHSSIATTSNIYVHTDRKEMEGVADALGRVLLEKPAAGLAAEAPVPDTVVQ